MDLRETFAGRLLTAYRAAHRATAVDRVVRLDELDLAEVAGSGQYVLIGRDMPQARAAIARLLPQLRHCAVSLAQRASVRNLASHRQADAVLAARGVDVRGVYDSWCLTAEIRAALTDAERDYCRAGCVTQQFILLDRRAVVLDGPPVDGGRERSTWLVGDPEVVRMAGVLFDTSWRSAREIEPASRRGGHLTDRQRRLVPLLLAGRSEASIARELGVAERTVSSDVRAMMTALGANGRVDLGYRLRIRDETAGR